MVECARTRDGRTSSTKRPGTSPNLSSSVGCAVVMARALLMTAKLSSEIVHAANMFFTSHSASKKNDVSTAKLLNDAESSLLGGTRPSISRANGESDMVLMREWWKVSELAFTLAQEQRVSRTRGKRARDAATKRMNETRAMSFLFFIIGWSLYC